MADNEKDLAHWRGEIDSVDEQMVALLNRRAKAAQEIGHIKKQSSQAIYVPNREQQVYDHIVECNQGPLPDAALTAIWREIISGCIALERTLTVGFLGPKGSFSHLAATQKFGSSATYVPQSDIRSVFMDVTRGKCQIGVVPIENSLGGSVIDTLDAFPASDVKICGEMIFPIQHCLLAKCAMDEIKVVYSKPEIFAQCRSWIANNLKGVDMISAASSARATELASQQENAAAIGSKLAAQLYEVPIVAEHIEDNPSNYTRFLIISKTPADKTGDDKTAILFATAHRSGALVEVLDIFRQHNVNLTTIDSRPSGQQRWEYYFYVDADGHFDDEQMQLALKEAKEHCLLLTVLGSYPKQQSR